MSTPAATTERRLVRVNVEQLPGAATLIGWPSGGGLAFAGRFASRAAAIVALLALALAIDEDSDADR